MNMDLTQANQLLKFLDEERQRDKTLITKLQERIDAQANQLSRQEERLQALQGSIGSVETLLARVSEFEQVVERSKLDVQNMLDKHDKERRREQGEVDQTRHMTMAGLQEEITRLNEKKIGLDKFQEALSALQLEDRRQSDALQNLEITIGSVSKNSQERVQAVSYLEEQRLADSRRITTLEAETMELRKQAGALDAQLLLSEKAAKKDRERLEEGLKTLAVIDEIRVAEFHREQQALKWDKQAGEIRDEMTALQEERQRFLQQYQETKKKLEELEKFRGQLDTRQNEVTEMQRLAEERFRQQWQEWQTEAEKERTRKILEEEESWKRQERVNDRQGTQIETLEVKSTSLADQLLAVGDLLTSQARGQISALQERLETVQKITQEVKET